MEKHSRLLIFTSAEGMIHQHLTYYISSYFKEINLTLYSKKVTHWLELLTPERPE